MDTSAPQLGKYARFERERRFLLAGLPPDLRSDAPHTMIEDRYLPGTRFRLRCMTESSSGLVTRKLTQKYAPAPGAFARTVITNSYLTPHEYALFATLPADVLRKDRYGYVVDGQVYAIDRFRGALEGLVLAEIELGSDEALDAFQRPAFALADVTDDEVFTGGALCRCSFVDLAPALARTR
jgi:CYTH domain-containing protein